MVSLKQDWHSMGVVEVAATLATNLETGMSEDQVRERQAEFGRNELQEAPRRGFWRRLLDQFNQFLVLILLAAALVSAFVGWREYARTGSTTEFVDAGAIMAIVILNAVLGVGGEILCYIW